MIERHDGTEVPVAPSLQPLLVLLCLAPSACRTRETVLAALWPDTDPAKAKARLSTALWRLRGLIRPDDGEDSDDRGERLLRTIEPDCPEADRWRELYDLDLQSIDWSDSSTAELRLRLEATAMLDPDAIASGCFHDWVVHRREALRLLSQRALATLAAANGDLGHVDRAIELAEILVRRDELREDGHRSLMQLYARAGRRGEALRQFDHCRRILETELGIEPMPETVELAHSIRDCRLTRSQPVLALAAEPSFPTGAAGFALSLLDHGDAVSEALGRARAALAEVETALGLQPVA